MDKVSVVTRGGGAIELEGGVLDSFASRLAGSLMAESSDGYEEARELWNAMIDTRPALIARCSGAQDVQTAIRFAAEHDLLISVR